MTATTDVGMEPAAKKTYLALDHYCAEAFPPGVDLWAAEEIRRVVAQIASDPADAFLQRHRIYTEDHPWFLVVIGTPSGVDHDISVSWTYADGLPTLLDVTLQYER